MTISVLAILTSLLGVSYTIKIQTHNLALLNLADKYEERKPAIFQAIRSAEYDVLCLQEVWFGSDVQSIQQTLDSNVGYYAPPLVKETIFWGLLNAPPCTYAPVTVACIFSHCASLTNLAAVVNCSVRCGMMDESQACISCLTASGTDALRCFAYGERVGMNTPGLMLLSKRKINSVKTVYYEPNVKQILKRAYIEAEIEGVGTIFCSHTSSNIGDEYYEPNLRHVYSSWEEQNLADSKKLTSAAKLVSKPLIVGDLNTSPSIPTNGVDADFEASYNHFLSEGYTSPYATMVGLCTFCNRSINALTQWPDSLLLDHVFVLNHTVLSARRMYVSNIPGKNFPLSDHYGVEVVLQNLTQSNRLLNKFVETRERLKNNIFL